MLKGSYRGYECLSDVRLACHIIFLVINISFLSLFIMWIPNWAFMSFLREKIPVEIQEGITAINPFLILLFLTGVICLSVGLFSKTTISFTDQEVGEENNA